MVRLYVSAVAMYLAHALAITLSNVKMVPVSIYRSGETVYPTARMAQTKIMVINNNDTKIHDI